MRKGFVLLLGLAGACSLDYNELRGSKTGSDGATDMGASDGGLDSDVRAVTGAAGNGLGGVGGSSANGGVAGTVPDGGSCTRGRPDASIDANAPAQCGDGLVEASEQCDDGNTTSGDGCSSTCMLECGWECPCGGAACGAAKCGDGKVAGGEQCDDGNLTDGDGCSAACTLESKPAGVPEGWVCTSPASAAGDGGASTCKGPTTCTTTVCGNSKVEGSEQCDDGNDVTGDGCSPFCRLEPKCPAAGGACTNVCGSGLILTGDGKQCDDGNTVNGDGCSSDCMIEPGFTCMNVPVNLNPLILPVVYHDFESWKDDPPHGHPDFQHYQGSGVAGMAQQMLGPKGVPVHAAGCVAWSSNNCAPGGATPTWDPTVDWFGMWYVDNAMAAGVTYDKTLVQTLTLGGQINGVASATCGTTGQPGCTSYQFSSTAFFPIDGMGWGNTPGQTHNFGFTSVTRYWFQYAGAATLTFFGDDDVFVFINKTLAVDLGGTHQRAQGGITLDASNGTGFSCDFAAPGPGNVSMGLAAVCDPTVATSPGHMVNLGLTKGSVYEIAVFFAQRHTTESNFQVTLSNFSGTKSVCTSTSRALQPNP